MPPLTSHRIEAIRSLADELGFDHCSLAPIKISEIDRDAYLTWCRDGRAAGMDYMTRDPIQRSDPTVFYPNARSVLTVAVSYFQGELPPKPGDGYGRVARYAWGQDYHPLILERLNLLLAKLPDVVGNVNGTAAVDTRPLLERALARQAGLGFTGKNTLLIVPRGPGLRFHVGSYIFLGEILLDVEADPMPSIVADGCGGCRKCLDACPTNAFGEAYQLDAGRCISYLTIENKGWISREMRPRIGDWVFGCDICQDVCPFNARAFETRWPELAVDRGAGAWLKLSEILRLTPLEFKSRFSATPLQRAKRRGLLRNACVVAGNSQDASLIPDLETLTFDSEPIVRGHALWALGALKAPGVRARAEALVTDPDADVAEESRVTLNELL